MRDDKNELGELKRVVNSLIQNMDELNKNNILIAATNIGRGPQFIIKPDLVHVGGNAGIDENGKLIVNGKH